MQLRKFVFQTDFDKIKEWIGDERMHAMWCANLIQYPLNQGNMEQVLSYAADTFGDVPFVATTDDGEVVGFFSYSLNEDKKEGMLKFVMVDPACRGKGVACEMLRLAVLHAFENPLADAISLNVFSENIRAKKCYEKVGFEERNTTPNAFIFQNESWGRCNMILRK